MSRHHHVNNNTVAALAFEDLSRCRSFEEDTSSPQPISDGHSSSRSSSFSSERLQHNPYLVDVLGECGAMHTSPLNLTRSPTKIHSGAASSHEDDSQYHHQQFQHQNHQQHQEFPSVPTSRSLSPYDASASASGASFWETPMGSTTTRSPVAHTPAAAFPASPTQSAPTPNTAAAKKHHHHRVKDPNVAAMAAHWTKYLQQQGIKPCSTTTSHVCPKVSSRPGAAQHHHMRGSSSSAPSSPLLPSTSSPGISTSVSRVYHNGRPVPVVVPKVVVATTTQ